MCPGASTIFYETGEPVNVDGGCHSRSPLPGRAASDLARAANADRYGRRSNWIRCDDHGWIGHGVPNPAPLNLLSVPNCASGFCLRRCARGGPPPRIFHPSLRKIILRSVLYGTGLYCMYDSSTSWWNHARQVYVQPGPLY